MRIKRILAFGLAFLMVLPLLTACKPAGNEDPTPTEEPVNLWELVGNGVANVSLVRSDYSTNKELISAFAKLGKFIQEATGVKISIETDYVKRGSPVPTDTAEILVGETNRQESIDALATLGENEYLIAVTGKRLVIIGQNDDATIEAIGVFMKTYMGYDEETGTCSKTVLAVPEALSSKGLYVPPVIDPSDPTEGLVAHHEAQNKQTTTPESYVTPTYKLTSDGYVQAYSPLAITGVKTTFQTNTNYSALYNIHSDSAMVYSTSNSNFDGWYKPGTYVVDMMLAINRAGSDYLNLDKSNYEDIQMDAGGNYLEHGSAGSGNYYMVPSEDWIEYCWYNMIKPMIEYNHPQTVVMEEPEMWIRSGYSETFKKEWEAYFGEEWQDPTSSAEATLKSNLLKTYLFERIISVMAERIKKLSPGTQVYIATHSTVNYTAWAIDAGLNHYMALGVLDGVIGQTWSDTHGSAFPYAGVNFTDNFTNAYLEYSSYVDSVEGCNFYALADPMADNTSLTEEDCQYLYRQSVVASLMQPEINRFQILPWVQRAYANVSGNYRTIQSQIFEALNDICGQSITMTAGTPGITYLISDSLSWMNSGNGFALQTTDGLYGICASLVREGIPTKMKSMDQITSAADLEGVTVLGVSYDSNVPLNEGINKAIADWVKAGGTLLCATGSNKYWDIDNYFYWKDDASPLNNLLKLLGLSDIKVGTVSSSPSATFSSSVSVISDEVAGRTLLSKMRSFALSFTGAKNPILKLGNETIGFEEDVGNGHVLVVGLPSAYYADTNEGCWIINALAEYALTYTDYDYITTEMMVTERGKYVAAHAFDEKQTLKGTYIDLYSPDLQVLTNPTVPANDSVLYVDVSKYDLSVPRLGFTAGNVTEGTLSETADKMTYTVTSSANLTLSNRILLPDGVYPASISVKQGDTELSLTCFYYDEATKSVFFSFEGGTEAITVTLTFSTSKVSIPTVNKVYNEVYYAVNQDEKDKEFLYSNSASANTTVRFCDLEGQVVYRFDLAKYPDATFRFNVSQNYIIEVSTDNENWTMIADVSNGGKLSYYDMGDNTAIIEVDPQKFNATDYIYVRFRNPFTSFGVGAAISRITIRTAVEGGEMTYAKLQPGTNNTTKKPSKSESASAQNEKKYLVATDSKTGVKTYKRSVKVSNANLDAEFIVTDTSYSNDGMRYCDNNSYIIYAFDVSGKLSAGVTLSVFQNYYLEASADGENWEVVADYSKGGTVPHLKTGGNQTNIKIDADDYGALETGTLYIRLSNTDPSQGWGGSLTQFVYEYTKK